MHPSLVLPGRGPVVATSLRRTATVRDRVHGLIGRPLSEGEALLIAPCRQVHTFGMPAPIDVVFCDADLIVVHVTRRMKPRRVGRLCWAARSAIELRAGAAEGVVAGDRLSVRDGLVLNNGVGHDYN
ncbi:MAG TPA: DUF192 domain-containing protein [Actinomycetota bacterium]|nr:DUF192 domain-containing protein [Actinomycetota bacterium]